VRRLHRLTALAIIVLSATTTAQAQDGGRIELPGRRGSAPGLAPGRYTVTLAAPTLAPALSLDEQVFSICYTAADAAAEKNPVMPAPQAARCSHRYMRIGRDMSFETTCPDGFHNLRLSPINDTSYQGTYRFNSAGTGQFIGDRANRIALEPAVRLQREGECEAAKP